MAWIADRVRQQKHDSLARRFVDALSPEHRDEFAYELHRRKLKSPSAQALSRALTPFSDGHEIEFSHVPDMKPFDRLAESFVKPLGFKERCRLSDDVYEARSTAMRALHRAMGRRGHYSQFGW